MSAAPHHPAECGIGSAAREPLRRAHSLTVFANGDTPQALAQALIELALRIAAGEDRAHGAAMDDASDVRFEYRRDRSMTRDRFFAGLERRLIELTAERKRR
jgi:hypothetical protein